MPVDTVKIDGIVDGLTAAEQKVLVKTVRTRAVSRAKNIVQDKGPTVATALMDLGFKEESNALISAIASALLKEE